ncbi:hypothetical protein P4E94_16270 [Pontiellaceae bacterium B12219]|nr:hypothetical protein [Pontiellaceae bacterium B12219]
MKRLVYSLAFLFLGTLLVSCSQEKEIAAIDIITGGPLYRETQFCILKSPERLSGSIITPVYDSFKSPIKVSVSTYGKEFLMTAHFQGNDGTNDLHNIDIRIPEEAHTTRKVTYAGNELIVHKDDDLVMLIRPKE